MLATQTAERAYRAQPGQTARLDVTLRAGPGALLAWLAQETILFDRCALHRQLRVEMAVDARLLVVSAGSFPWVSWWEGWRASRIGPATDPAAGRS